MTTRETTSGNTTTIYDASGRNVGRFTIAVSRHTDSDIKEVCNHNVGRRIPTSPIGVTVVAEDMRGKSAKNEIIEGARGRMQ